MPSIEERLVALERRYRRARQANVALVVLVAVGRRYGRHAAAAEDGAATGR